ncbi:MAG: hypothetical protein M3M88_04900 [Thermoproteota archaeon]|nr:hypothetical protein [Thermoproteota archaeon]
MDVMSGIEDIAKKYDDFINTIKTQLPKVSKSLIFELMPLLKEEKESPGYNLQIHVKDNANKDELKSLILKEWGVVPAFYEHNHAVVEHRINLQLLKQLNDLDSVDSISGSRSGGGRSSRGPVLERDDDHPAK